MPVITRRSGSVLTPLAVVLMGALFLAQNVYAESAEGESPSLTPPPEVSPATPTDQPETTQDIPPVHIEAGTGVAALISRGDSSLALTGFAGIGWRIDEHWLVHLVWSAKDHPWLGYVSLFQTLGPAVRFFPWRGLFVEAGGGFAAAFVSKDGYQQAEYGGGWLVRAGYEWAFHKHLALIGLAAVNQRYVAALYTDIGGGAALAARF